MLPVLLLRGLYLRTCVTISEPHLIAHVQTSNFFSVCVCILLPWLTETEESRSILNRLHTTTQTMHYTRKYNFFCTLSTPKERKKNEKQWKHSPGRCVSLLDQNGCRTMLIDQEINANNANFFIQLHPTKSRHGSVSVFALDRTIGPGPKWVHQSCRAHRVCVRFELRSDGICVFIVWTRTR